MAEQSVIGEKYVGCFVDSKDRDFSTRVKEGNGNYKKCLSAVHAKGFKFAGLQYGGTCWGGNSFGKHGQKSDDECNMECTDDKGRMCGAGWRNSVFSFEGMYQHTSILGESYAGCFLDSKDRDFSTRIRNGYGQHKKMFQIGKGIRIHVCWSSIRRCVLGK
jgi:hypothetical protein